MGQKETIIDEGDDLDVEVVEVDRDKNLLVL